MRIARALALAGIASRRASEVYVRRGEVRVNGQVVTDLGRQVDLEQDEVLFRGKPLSGPAHFYYMLNKPEGYVTTACDAHAKKTVYDLLPGKLVRATRRSGEDRVRVYPVGRLDKDSMGLLLFTNDGALANRLTHPRYQVVKCYRVRLHRAFEMKDERQMREGIRLKDGLAKVHKVEFASRRVILVYLSEGKKREVRRMLGHLDYTVVWLQRVAFGPLQLGDLALGQGLFLTKTEVRWLKDIMKDETFLGRSPRELLR